MSEKIEDKGPRPRTRREALEEHGHGRSPYMGGPEVHSTAHEPLPDVEHSGYHDVQVQENRIEFEHRGFAIAAFTMVLLSLITFYIPLFNGLLGGVIGGFFARRYCPALGAAALASVMVPALLAFFYGWDTPDFLYFFSGLGYWGWAALHVFGLFVGAVAGVFGSHPVRERQRPGEATGR